MKVATRKIKIGLLLLFLGFAAFAVSIPATQHTVTAAVKNGFVTSGGKTYYYKNGVKQKGWLTLNGKKYYFNTSSGVQVQGWITLNKNRYYFTKHSNPSKRTMAVGWRKDASGKRRYFLSTGAQVRGKFLKISGKLYYFASNGIMQTGWIKIGSNKYYANSTGAIYTNKLAHDSKRDIYRYFDKNGKMIRGWYTFAKGERYFQNGGSKDGVMARGKLKISGKYYYFRTDYGYKQTGWVTDANGNQYYCDASNNGAMVVSTTKTINGIEYVFDSAGIAKQKNSVEAKKSTGTKTIRNYLLGCMLPVGQALYVWGGGWNDSNRKGVSPKWKQWYDSQTSSYNYNNYRDLSTANRAKGLDCSGFVGWAA